MTNINIFIEREGQTKGPFSFEQIQQFSQNGTLRPDDLVWPEGSQQKQIAKNVSGLAFSSANATQAPTLPPTSQPITYAPKTEWSTYTKPVSHQQSNVTHMLNSAGIADYGGDPREKAASMALMEDQLRVKASGEGAQSDKSYIVAILLCFFLGPLGIHRFYLGHIFTGLIQFLTGGCFWIGSTIDLFLIIFRVLKDKDGGRLS